jgi:hypothetical protein
MSEVSAALSTGNYTDESESFNKDPLQRYYQDLVKDEQREAAASATASGNRTSWTRGKLL